MTTFTSLADNDCSGTIRVSRWRRIEETVQELDSPALNRLSSHCLNNYWARQVIPASSVVSSSQMILPPTYSSVVPIVLQNTDWDIVVAPSGAFVLSRDKSPSQMIADIRAAFCLQIKELAEIIGVERPTIYGWISKESQPQRHNLTRLREIHGFSEEWNRLCTQPAGVDVRHFLTNEMSLIDLFAEDPIDKFRVKSHLLGLATHLREKNLAKEKKPRSENSWSDSQSRSEVLDAATGKRTSLE